MAADKCPVRELVRGKTKHLVEEEVEDHIPWDSEDNQGVLPLEVAEVLPDMENLAEIRQESLHLEQAVAVEKHWLAAHVRHQSYSLQKATGPGLRLRQKPKPRCAGQSPAK